MTRIFIIVFVSVFIFSCNIKTENEIIGEYIYKKNHSLKNIWKKKTVYLMQNNSFSYKQESESMGYKYSNGNWKLINKKTVKLNSTSQIDSNSIKIIGKFKKFNSENQIITFYIQSELMPVPINSFKLFLNSDKDKTVEINDKGFGRIDCQNIINLNIDFNTTAYSYLFIPTDNKSNEFVITFKFNEFDNYLFIKNKILKIKYRKVILNDRGKNIVFKKIK